MSDTSQIVAVSIAAAALLVSALATNDRSIVASLDDEFLPAANSGLYSDADAIRMANMVSQLSAPMSREAIFRELGIDPERLENHRVGGLNRVMIEIWQLSESYQVKLCYDYAFPLEIIGFEIGEIQTGIHSILFPERLGATAQRSPTRD